MLTGFGWPKGHLPCYKQQHTTTTTVLRPFALL